ncbi:hypothetical protein LXL04_020859 [Taraxacum kok-saghyz]
MFERTVDECVDFFYACVIGWQNNICKTNSRWHAYFWVVRFNNDQNVLLQSPIFNDIWYGRAIDMACMVNGHVYKHGSIEFLARVAEVENVETC